MAPHGEGSVVKNLPLGNSLTMAFRVLNEAEEALIAWFKGHFARISDLICTFESLDRRFHQYPCGVRKR